MRSNERYESLLSRMKATLPADYDHVDLQGFYEELLPEDQFIFSSYGEEYERIVTEAVHANDASIGVSCSVCVSWPLVGDMLLFRDADGDHFAAAWRGALVIDEAPFELH